jgi:hypothetical protein
MTMHTVHRQPYGWTARQGVRVHVHSKCGVIAHERIGFYILGNDPHLVFEFTAFRCCRLQ